MQAYSKKDCATTMDVSARFASTRTPHAAELLFLHI